MALRLRCSLPPSRHNEQVASLAAHDHGFISSSDDSPAASWSHDGDFTSSLIQAPSFCVIDLHISSANFIACACSDGCIRLFAINGREEKCCTVTANGAAVTSVRWSPDATAFATATEDGTVKVWSRSGMLRSSLAALQRCAYAVRWGPDGNSILYSAGSELTVASLKMESGSSSSGSATWKAHDGVVLVCDWSTANDRIVSGGEDGKYKVWDSMGRPLYTSSPCDQPVTSISWSPSGREFAVGHLHTLRVCHASGWCAARESMTGGSVTALAWSKDGTTVAAGLGDGRIAFCTLLDRTYHYSSLSATQSEQNRLLIADDSSGLQGAGQPVAVDLRDRIVEVVMSRDHILAVCPGQIHILGRGAWHAPRALELKDPQTDILASNKHFMCLDGAGGASVYGYDGRLLLSAKLSARHPGGSCRNTVSLGPDCIVYCDGSDGRTIRTVDFRTGRQVGSSAYSHSSGITWLAVSQGPLGGLAERTVAFIDSSQALYVYKPAKLVAGSSDPSSYLRKIAAVCDAAIWSDSDDGLLAAVDGQLQLWLVASGLLGDVQLADMSKTAVEGATSMFGLLPSFVSFSRGRVTASRADGSLVHVSAPLAALPTALYESILANQWLDAVRLCRQAKARPLFASLAVMSLGGAAGRHLESAEVALAQLSAVDRLEWLARVRQKPLVEERSAELAVYRRSVEEAEGILLSAGLRMRAVKLNIRLGRWQRALEVARAAKNPVFIETVLVYRARHLQTVGGLGREPASEVLPALTEEAIARPQLDWDTVKESRKAEKQREAAALAQASSGNGARALNLEGKADT